MPSRMILLDRDGTLVKLDESQRYLYGDHPFEFLPNVAICLKTIQQSGISLAVCTNQQGISLSDFPDMTVKAVHRFHKRINDQLAKFDVKPLSFFVCPHNKDDGCQCRKPAPGLLLDAMNINDAKSAETWFVGDQKTDVTAAKRAGVQPIHLLREDNESFEDGVVGVGNWRSICRLQELGVTTVYKNTQSQRSTEEWREWVRLNQVAYDRAAEFYGPRTARFAEIEQKFMSRLFQTHLSDTSDGFVVDCGCGPARDAEFFLKFGWMYLGVDNSNGMLEVAANRLKPIIEGEWALINADMVSFELPQQSVVFFVCNSSIQHIDRQRLYPWLCRVQSFLKRRGLFYLHFRIGQGGRKEWSYEYVTKGICRQNFYHCPADISSYLTGLGFEILVNEQYVTDYEQDDVRKKTQVPSMCRIVARKTVG